MIPGLVATSVYGQPVWLMITLEKLATPWLAWTCVVPDSVPEPGFAPMFRVMTAVELVTTLLSPPSTSTKIGLAAADWPTWDVIGDPATPPAGSFKKAREQLPDTVAPRTLAESRMKSLLGPLNWFDCFAATLHPEAPPLHGALACTISVADWVGLRPRFRNSAELAVYEALPTGADALVITKPAGAVTWTDPSVWVVASFFTVKVNAWLRPAATLGGSTVAR